MQYGELIDFLQNVGKDPSRLIFEDELTGIHNRRFLHSYIEHKVHWDSEDSFPLSLARHGRRPVQGHQRYLRS